MFLPIIEDQVPMIHSMLPCLVLVHYTCFEWLFNLSVVREQWIRAKYERKEFVSPPMTAYADDYLEGILYKRGKEDGKFLPRKFVLSSVEGTLKYFVKEVKYH